MSEHQHIFISGQMTGVGNYNFPLFDHVARKFRERGFEVFNPADLAREKIGSLEVIKKMDKRDYEKARRELLKYGLTWICEKADVLVLLPGWAQSSGARAERKVALALGIEIRELPNLVVRDAEVLMDFPAEVE